MYLLNRLVFSIVRPNLIIVAGSGREAAIDAICQVLSLKFKVLKGRAGALPVIKGKGDILIVDCDLADDKIIEDVRFLLKDSVNPILAVPYTGDISNDKNLFSGDSSLSGKIKEIAKLLPLAGHIILNFDDESAHELKSKSRAKSFTFGFERGADFHATDINTTIGGTNFKMGNNGSVIPFWLKKIYGKENIYGIMAAAACAAAKNFNLIEISKAFEKFQAPEGKMQILSGINGSSILDNSRNTTTFQTIESLDILKNIKNENNGRRIAVLGDILGPGKYTISGHEEIGIKAGLSCDLLFTVGARTRFLINGAKKKKMPENKIFYFRELAEAKEKLKTLIKMGDFVLIDGSVEMKMEDIARELIQS